MKFAIVGSRDFNDYKYMKSVLDYMPVTHIISGGAIGADLLARRYARENDIAYTEYPAYWEKQGKQAGAIRNNKMVKDCDEVIAFWDGRSPGTRITVNMAGQHGKKANIFKVKPFEIPSTDKNRQLQKPA